MSVNIEEVLDGLSIPSAAPVTKTVDGEHPVRADCIARALMGSIDDVETVRERAGTLILLLAGGRCPRCQQILDDISTGSAVNEDRCIPVCGDCTLEESTDFRDISEWPVAMESPSKKRRRDLGGVEVESFPKPELAGQYETPVVEASDSEDSPGDEPTIEGLWPLSPDGKGDPQIDSIEDAAEQVLHYKRMSSLRKRSLEAAIDRIYELEAVIRDMGGTPPPWDQADMEESPGDE